jgi:hypothetical protein
VPVPAKEVYFLCTRPFLCSLNAPPHLPCRSRLTGCPRRRCAALNGP